jgi:hypothetical protein
MEQPDLEIIVSWDPNDYTLEPDDGREVQLLDRIIAAKDRATVLDQTRRRLFVPYPVREWQFHKADPDPWPSPLHGHHCEEPIKLDAVTGELWEIPTRRRVGRLKREELKRIQSDLLRSKDLGEKSRLYLPAERVKELLG